MFTIILALFLVGIAIGAVLLGFLRPRVRPTTLLIAMAQVLTAAFVLVGAAVLASPHAPFNGIVAGLRERPARTSPWPPRIIVLPPTIVMGLTFPATAALLGDESGTEGSATGSLLAVNTAGSLVATFVLPFFVIPLIGSPATLALPRDRERGRRRGAVPGRAADHAVSCRWVGAAVAAVAGVRPSW